MRLERWSTKEFRTFLENAGSMDARHLSRAVGRPVAELEEVADRLYAIGYHVSVTLGTCPICGRRARLSAKTGICRTCSADGRLGVLRARVAALEPLMSPRDRRTYRHTDTRLGGRVSEPRPKAPALDKGATPAERRRAKDGYDAAVDDWSARRAERRLRAAQKRYERMVAHARANGATDAEIMKATA